MPLPFIIATGAIGLLGIGGHLSAKETNEKAEMIVERAKNVYHDARLSLETAKYNAEESLTALGYAKKNVLEGSIKQFVQAFERIKDDVRLRDSTGMNEVSHFAIDEQGITELRKMSDIYSSMVSSGAAGMATGALIGLAANGTLSLVGTGLSIAGNFLAVGELTGAAAIAGTSLSMGMSLTPLSAFVAPVVLFTAISASSKADENLEKANAKLAEIESAVEKMKVSETMCNAIAERADMFRELLVELDEIFSDFAKRLDCITEKKMCEVQGGKIRSGDLTEEELNVARAAKALAGAVKAVIDVPMLSKEGKLTIESQTTYDEVRADYNKKLESGIIQKKPKSSTIFCTGCGKKIARNAKFCNYCGKKNTY